MGKRICSIWCKNVWCVLIGKTPMQTWVIEECLFRAGSHNCTIHSVRFWNVTPKHWSLDSVYFYFILVLFVFVVLIVLWENGKELYLVKMMKFVLQVGSIWNRRLIRFVQFCWKVEVGSVCVTWRVLCTVQKHLFTKTIPVTVKRKREKIFIAFKASYCTTIAVPIASRHLFGVRLVYENLL